MKKLVIVLFVILLFNLVGAVDCVEKCVDRGYYSGYCSDACEEVDIGYNCEQQSLVDLVISDSVENVYTDGTKYIDEDDDYPEWIWHIDNMDTKAKTENINGNDVNIFAGPVLGVKNSFYANSIDNDLNGSAQMSMGEGDEICFPEVDYLCMEYTGITEVTYDAVTIDVTSIDLSSFNATWTSKTAIYLYAGDADSMKTSTGVSTDKFWIVSNDSGDYVSVFYEDSLSSKVLLGTYLMDDAADDNNFAEMDYYDTTGSNVQFDLRGDFSSADSLDLVLDVLGDEGLVSNDGRDDVTISLGHTASYDFDSIGSTVATAEAGELVWDGTSIGTKDEDHLSLYGIQILNPESNGGSDEVKFNVPSDQVLVQVTIHGVGNKTEDLEYNYSFEQFGEWQEIGDVVLASEVTSPRDYNLILVGGPCANSLVTALFGYTCLDWDLEEGEGIIKLVENGDNYALLLAGTSVDDTERVYNVMLNYTDYNLYGMEFLVTEDGVEEILDSEGNVSVARYPWPFIKDYVYDSFLVAFGDDALSKDVIGATDVLYDLQNLSKGYEWVVTNSSGEVEYGGSISDWIALGNNLSDSGFFSSVIYETSLDQLQDGSFNYGSDEIDFRDIMVLYKGGPTVHTGLTAGEDAYTSTPYIEIEQGELRYYLMFDDEVDPTLVTPSNSLSFRFLGEWIEIEGFEDGNKLSLLAGEEYLLGVGESVIVSDVNITVEDADENGLVELSVDGNLTLIQPLQRKEEQGLFIKNQQVFYHEGGDCCCMDISFY